MCALFLRGDRRTIDSSDVAVASDTVAAFASEDDRTT